MILWVAATDLLFAALAFLGYRTAPTRLTRGLCAGLAVYCLIETFLHVPMEVAAGRVMRCL